MFSFIFVLAMPAFAQLQAEGGGQALAALARFEQKTPGPTPKAADGKPSLAGLWGPDKRFMYDIVSALKPGEELPIQPWALQVTRERVSNQDPDAHCLPTGIPRMSPYPWKIVQMPELILFLYEGNMHTYRQIFMDGRGHPDDFDPSWYGHSVGRWEGDTLVVDSIGFNDKFWFDGAGHPHTEKLHITERFHRPDSAHLDIAVTIDDPGAYTKPFTIYAQSKLLVNTEIMEYICNENFQQDLPHIVGKDDRK
jgi:hypothetical protein